MKNETSFETSLKQALKQSDYVRLKPVIAKLAEDEAIESATYFMRILTPFYFVVAAKLVADGILRGAGIMKSFMAATFTDLILRVVFAIILSKTGLGYIGIWLAWPIGWCVAAYMSIRFYRKRGWENNSI